MTTPEPPSAAEAVREHIILDADSAIRWFEHG